MEQRRCSWAGRAAAVEALLSSFMAVSAVLRIIKMRLLSVYERILNAGQYKLFPVRSEFCCKLVL